MSYDPTIGRWTTEDPIAFEGGDANLYRYVGNSPTNHIDPSGTQEVDLGPALRDKDVRDAIQKDVDDARRRNSRISNPNNKIENGGFILHNPDTGNFIVSHKGVNIFRRSPRKTHFQPSGPRDYDKSTTPPTPSPDFRDDNNKPLPGYKPICTYHTHIDTNQPDQPDKDDASNKVKLPGIIIGPNGQPFQYGPGVNPGPIRF